VKIALSACHNGGSVAKLLLGARRRRGRSPRWRREPGTGMAPADQASAAV